MMMVVVVVVMIVDTELQSFLKHMGVTWGAPGADAPQGDENNFFLGIFVGMRQHWG